jgi:hypothetical protein
MDLTDKQWAVLDPLIPDPRDSSGPFSYSTFYLQNAAFSEWAMLGSNQRPPPCKRSAKVFRTFLEFTKFLQIAISSERPFSQDFRIFTWVAARLLHISPLVYK